MATIDLAKELRDITSSIKQLSEIYEIPWDDSTRSLRQTIYELICYFFIAKKIVEMNVGCDLQIIPGQNSMSFCHGSASKKGNFCALKFYNLNINHNGTNINSVVLYHATRVVDIDKDEQAPDVVLALYTSADELHNDDVLMIWDAKLRDADDRHRISNEECSKFKDYLEVLRLTEKAYWEPIDQIIGEPFDFPLLITNGARPTKPESYFIRNKFSILESFVHSLNGTLLFPEKARHLAARANTGINKKKPLKRIRKIIY